MSSARYGLVLASVFTATAGLVGPVRAFSDPALFVESTEIGGGDRRYFTGSPVDGYSCAVCHRGGETPHVTIRGLPRAGYTPGQSYPVEITWDQPERPLALQLEFVTKSGVSPGVQIAADGAPVDPREYCGQNPELTRATYLEEDRGRQILGVRDCHAAALNFVFTAPAEPELAFSATFVRSDSSATPDGDGTREVNLLLRPLGSETRVSSGCQVRHGQPRGSLPWLWLGALFSLVAVSRRRSRPCALNGSRGSA